MANEGRHPNCGLDVSLLVKDDMTHVRLFALPSSQGCNDMPDEG